MKKIKSRIYQLYVIIKYTIVKVFNVFCRKTEDNIWLLSERGIDARDNSYVFYKYLKKEHPEINVKFVISHDSIDLEKIDEVDRVETGSFKHIYYYLNAKKLISTHIMGFAPEMRVFNKFRKINFFVPKGNIVFLQHGITSNYINFLLKDNVGKLNLFISGSKFEYEFLLNTYGYNENVVKYTGFARYDNLIDFKENAILLMPTWRKKLFYVKDETNFKQTDYFKRFNSLINNKELIKYLEDKNIILYFYPHYEVQRFISTFKSLSKNVIIADMKNYDVQDLLKRSKILITDYSSVFYDFAYMKKEVIYYQFDYNDFFEKHYEIGNFNFKKHGFGPVCDSEKSVVENILKVYENGIEEKFLKRINNYFSLNDTKNCERIFKEIIKLK